MQVVSSLKARLFAFQTIIMQQENEQEVVKQILLKRLQKSVGNMTESKFESINPGSHRTQTYFRFSPLLYLWLCPGNNYK